MFKPVLLIANLIILKSSIEQNISKKLYTFILRLHRQTKFKKMCDTVGFLADFDR